MLKCSAKCMVQHSMEDCQSTEFDGGLMPSCIMVAKFCEELISVCDISIIMS